MGSYNAPIFYNNYLGNFYLYSASFSLSFKCISLFKKYLLLIGWSNYLFNSLVIIKEGYRSKKYYKF